MDIFKGRELIIATKHRKEEVMAHLLEQALGVHCQLAQGLDTDLLGTFSGECERKDDALVTLRKKCQIALTQCRGDLVVASEGSFGPDPNLYFVPANEELVMLMDLKNGLEIVEREISLKTNFCGAMVHTTEELWSFAQRAGFPSHALILRRSEKNAECLVKGITEPKQLAEWFDKFLTNWGAVYVETDMRAMFNPTRMEVIRQATLRLVERIASRCPQCKCPGFGITDRLPGLPCRLCGSPTPSAKAYVLECSRCHHQSQKLTEKQYEEPGCCIFCNP